MGYLGAVPLTPGTYLVVGLVAFGVSCFFARRGRGAGRDEAVPWIAARYRALATWRALAPVFVIGAALLGGPVTLFIVATPQVAWWRYAAALVGALVPLAGVLLAVLVRIPVEAPLTRLVRRTPLSYGRRGLVSVVASLSAVLVVTSIVAGLASVPDDDGWYVWLPILGDTSPGYSTFYGWGYSVAALVALATVLALLTSILRTNAARPFAGPGSFDAENRLRHATATTALSIAGGALLLTVGAVLTFVGDSAMVRVGGIIPGYGEIWFAPGYAAIAPALVWIGFAGQVVAVVWLLLAATGRSFRRMSEFRPAPAVKAEGA